MRVVLQRSEHPALGSGLEFDPGQFLEVEVPGTDLRRAYSLANPPNLGTAGPSCTSTCVRGAARPHRGPAAGARRGAARGGLVEPGTGAGDPARPAAACAVGLTPSRGLRAQGRPIARTAAGASALTSRPPSWRSDARQFLTLRVDLHRRGGPQRPVVEEVGVRGQQREGERQCRAGDPHLAR